MVSAPAMATRVTYTRLSRVLIRATCSLLICLYSASASSSGLLAITAPPKWGRRSWRRVTISAPGGPPAALAPRGAARHPAGTTPQPAMRTRRRVLRRSGSRPSGAPLPAEPAPGGHAAAIGPVRAPLGGERRHDAQPVAVLSAVRRPGGDGRAAAGASVGHGDGHRAGGGGHRDPDQAPRPPAAGAKD